MSQPSFPSGHRLGPYEIVSLVGAGGMGQVYRGRDPRIDRTVAIKVLPATVSEDPERRERFEREARVIGSLHHPHICTLFDVGEQDGIQFLVMEYLEGETLAARLARGALPIELALRHAVAIAGALAEAHRHGVIHRDLKPGNVLLTRSGAKIVDFGLAKLRAMDGVDGLSSAPTRAKDLTEEGILLGTLRYMAPEQLEGGEVDARADIFALGEIVYEMVTGRKAFEEKNQASLVAAILDRQPPPVSTHEPVAPPALDRAVEKCLAKSPEERWQTARDLRDELQWIAEAGPGGTALAGASGRSPVKRLLGYVVVAMVATVGGALALWVLGRGVPERSVIRAVVPISPAEALDAGVATALALSPDGTRLAYVGRSGERSQIYVRDLSGLQAMPLPGTEGGRLPFFSPDGRWLAFFVGRELKKISLLGGAPLTLCRLADTARGASWGTDGRIVFSPGLSTGLSWVSAEGGEPQVLTTPMRERREKTHRFPEVLPDGRAVLFFAGGADLASWDDGQIAVASLETGDRKVLVEGGMNPRFAASGHLLYARAGALFATPFDPVRLEITGPATPVLEGVRSSPIYGQADYAVSRDGMLVYASGDGRAPQRRLVWVDREGKATPVISPVRRSYEMVRLSPDGRRVAITIEGGNAEVWLLDLERSAMTRLAWGWDHGFLTWAPDGRRVTINSTRFGPWNLFSYPADGSGPAERLTTSEWNHIPGSWTPDGRMLAFTMAHPRTSSDIWILPDGGDPRPFLQTPAREANPEFSPDGRFLAYVSDESGRREVYVRPFPGPGAKWQISTQGGRAPAWARSGRELFYRDGDKMMAVEVRTSPDFAPSTPRVLFERPARAAADFVRSYDVAPGGDRFLMIEPEPNAPVTELHLVTHWFEELHRLAPAR